MINTNNCTEGCKIPSDSNEIKIMLSNIISLLTGGEILYFEDIIDISNSDADLKFRHKE